MATNSFAREALVLEIGGGSKPACSYGDTDSGAGGLSGMSLVDMSPSAQQCKRGQTPAREEGPACFFLFQVGFMMMVVAMTGGSRSTALGGGRRRERGWYCQAGLDRGT